MVWVVVQKKRMRRSGMRVRRANAARVKIVVDVAARIRQNADDGGHWRVALSSIFYTHLEMFTHLFNVGPSLTLVQVIDSEACVFWIIQREHPRAQRFAFWVRETFLDHR